MIELIPEVREIGRKLIVAQSKFREAKRLEDKIFCSLYKLGVLNPDKIQSNAENASNLEEAITCFMQYGEYDIDSILDEIMQAISK